MKKITTNSYEIRFSNDGYDYLNSLLSKKSYSKLFVIVDENTEKYCLEYFKSKTSINPSVLKIKSGEKNKNLETCKEVWYSLTEMDADRMTLIINLGGGVITDMGGFIASTFKRGLDFINIPTTLLSMVDASIGSKTGINLNLLKNQIGLFSDPQLVIIDTNYLKTLNEREIKSGYAEIIKHCIISNSFFDDLIDRSSIHYNEDIIYNSIQIKNKIVSLDKLENNIRKNLNFGHTIGHAIESFYLNKEGKLLHGEAISIGMICESFISYKKINFSLETAKKIKTHLNSIYPKINFNKNDLKEILSLMKYDKKNYLKNIRFSLLKEVGKVEIDVEIDENLILDSFDFYSN